MCIQALTNLVTLLLLLQTQHQKLGHGAFESIGNVAYHHISTRDRFTLLKGIKNCFVSSFFIRHKNAIAASQLSTYPIASLVGLSSSGYLFWGHC